MWSNRILGSQSRGVVLTLRHWTNEGCHQVLHQAFNYAKLLTQTKQCQFLFMVLFSLVNTCPVLVVDTYMTWMTGCFMKQDEFLVYPSTSSSTVVFFCRWHTAISEMLLKNISKYRNLLISCFQVEKSSKFKVGWWFRLKTKQKEEAKPPQSDQSHTTSHTNKQLEYSR